jgi:DNA-binding response OmpR family regulator
MEKTALQRSQKKSGRKVILAVVDEPILKKFYQFALEDDYDIFIASSGEEAFETLKTLGGIDLVLLDLKLSGSSVVDVLREMKRSFPCIPVMIVKARKKGKTMVESTDLGACYVEKPFEVGDMLKKIKSLVEKKR